MREKQSEPYVESKQRPQNSKFILRLCPRRALEVVGNFCDILSGEYHRMTRIMKVAAIKGVMSILHTLVRVTCKRTHNLWSLGLPRRCLRCLLARYGIPSPQRRLR
ncbi:hypothetical protein PILCRDRAFT_511826 [Piloderma croceum F 1598]|uniref:Uncharacterized protein n=1 Tax=Piloderma croceum (strain F 1598) TaxID=765440 RepID=A0A0C3FMR4_PILCF|nr:hypothetical protein PILCRDRAFT_511826 [Piloderma croceum F 1598]